MIYPKMKTLDTPRWITHNGKLYAVRDVWVRDKWREELNRCEYATWSNNLQKLVWTPCPEGSIFADVKPLGDVMESGL